jgi:GNAT superfamily N-acetyltransferase
MESLRVSLVRAELGDAHEIHEMQLTAFKPLLDKYQDFDINPGAEPIEKVLERLRQPFTHFYLIKLEGASIGAIRIVLKEDGERCRISPIFILPEYQNKGFAQQVFKEIEKIYAPKHGWELDTILEEAGNCHLYEKMGYSKTGKAEKIHDKMTIVFYQKPGN